MTSVSSKLGFESRMGLEAGVVPGKELFYMPVPQVLSAVYVAAMNGDVDGLKSAWRPQVGEVWGLFAFAPA